MADVVVLDGRQDVLARCEGNRKDLGWTIGLEQ